MTLLKTKTESLPTLFSSKSARLLRTIEESKALILLSIKGNDFCTGVYLSALIEETIHSCKFTSILIADEIYWHNLRNKMLLSEQDIMTLKEEATTLGDKYINEQLPFFLKPLNLSSSTLKFFEEENCTDKKIARLNQLASEKFEIIRWSDWIKKTPTAILNKLDNIYSAYQYEPLLKNSIIKQATNFANRHQAEDNFELLKCCSQGYLTEESPHIILVSSVLGYNFIMYPGEMPKPFLATKDFFINHPTNNEINIPLENPHLFANWIQANFKPTLKNATKISFFKAEKDLVVLQSKEQAKFLLSQSEDTKKQVDLLVNYINCTMYNYK